MSYTSCEDMKHRNGERDFSFQLRQIGAATLATTLSIGFAYTSMNLFMSNQRNYLRNFKKFLTAKHTCRVVHQPLPTNENKLIYISDNINPTDCISDNIFQLKFKPEDNNIIYLYRECQMYQWTESTSTIANKYSKIWSSTHIDSTLFEERDSHQNPLNMIESKLFHSKHFTVSNFTFNLKDNESITEPKLPIWLLLKYAKVLKEYEIDLNGNKSKTRENHSRDGWYYFSNHTIDDETDRIGDIRLRLWIITKPLPLTVIGIQMNQKINLFNNGNNDNICMRSIGHYNLDHALKKRLHVKLLNNETGSILVMTHIALSCFIYAIELVKPMLKQSTPDVIKNTDCNEQIGTLRANELGLRALLGTVSICAPVYCLSSLYPHMEILYGKHPTLMNSMCALAVASVVVGSTQRFSKS